MHYYLLHFSLPNEYLETRRVLINGFSYPVANHEEYEGEGSAELIKLSSFESEL